MAGVPGKQKSADRAPESFSQLIDFHIKRGTRPKGTPDALGPAWTNPDFAAAIGLAEGTGERTVQNWRTGRAVPAEIGLIEQALFGENALYAGWRAELREAHRKARNPGAAGPAEDVVPAPTRAKPIGLPYPPLGSLFKGRDDFLKQLHQSLTGGAGRTAIVSSAVYGLGGVGKTRAAVEYAWAHEKDYTALLFVIAQTPEALRRNLAALTGPLVLNLPEHGADKEDIRIQAALDWLKAHPGWFLILDDLDTPEVLAEADRLMGRLTGGHVVATSRLANFAGNFAPLALDVLSVDDAAAFLLERTEGRRQPTDDDAAAARSLAVALGQLALALEQAGAHIARLAISFSRYRQLRHANWPKVAGWTDETITKYPRSVAVTWQTSVDQIGIPARRLLERLAWFAPEPVPDFMTAVPVPGMAAEDLDEALADLSNYSLVRRHPARREFSVHRLVQDMTRRSLGGEDARAALMQALTWLDACFTGDAGDLAVRSDMERLAPHVRSAVERGNDMGIKLPTASLALRLADLLSDRVPLHELEPLYRLALAIFDRLAQADPGNAGWQRDLSVSYEKVGDVLVAQGNLPEALKAFRHSHDIFNRLAKADPGNAGWQGDLIVSYAKLAGIDQTGARTFLTQAQQIAEGMQRRGQLAPRDLWILDALATRLAALPN